MVKFPVKFRSLLSATFRIPIGGSIAATAAKCCGIVAVVLLLPILMQYLHLLNVQGVFKWMDIFPGPRKVNTAIIVLLLLIFYCIFNSLSYGLAALTVFCLTFSIADMQKMRILHQPLLPGDLLFFKQALLVTRMYTSGLVLGVLVVAAVIFLMVLLRKRLLHCRLPWRPRVVFCTVVAGSLLLITVNFRPVILSVNRQYNIVDEFWNQLSNYRKNGVLYAFLLNIESLRINRPNHYSREVIDRLFAPYLSLPPRDTSAPAPRPDVIIYMNESFWDVTRLPSITLPCDPIPHFRALTGRNQSLTLYSPVFGGNTCDAEFEVLTGMPNGYFPPGARAYNQFIQRPIPSLVRVFGENGYRTTAIHTFKRWFWNRGNVYRHLGFDSFVSLEDMDQPVKKGTYVGDEELARQIISRLDTGGAPHFIFALSMQNHGPYDEHRYDSLDCPVPTGMSIPADREYNTYVQGLVDADRSLNYLTDYIQKTSRPTILFFFGDHLPGFTHVYKETGCEQKIKENRPWSFATRGVWYSNVPLPQQQDTAVSMVFLPLIISRLAHLSTPPYYRFIDELRMRNPVVSGRTVTFSPSSRPPGVAAANGKDDDPCWTIIYDVLFGKGYSFPYHHIGTPAAAPEPADTVVTDRAPAAQ